jgi:hypothetical protein
MALDWFFILVCATTVGAGLAEGDIGGVVLYTALMLALVAQNRRLRKRYAAHKRDED